MLGNSITIGTRRRVRVSMLDALAVNVAYFWQTVNGGSVSARNPYKFAGHSYDFVLRECSSRIVAGIYASAGLNSDMGAAQFLPVLAAHNAGLIPELSDEVAFWDMDVNQLATDPNDHSPAGLLWAYYKAFMGVKVNGIKTGGIEGVGTAGYSKSGHWGWPRQVPLVDSVILKFWTGNNLWVELHRTLNDNREWFDELERLIEAYRVNFQNGDGVPIYRLRATDVVTWVNGSSQWDETLAAGKQLLAACTNVATW